MKKLITIPIAIILLCSLVSAQRLPATNTDLQTISDYADKVILESQACTGTCVELSCSAAANIYSELKRMEEILILLGALESGPGKDYTVALADWQYELLQSEYKPTLEQELRTRETLVLQDFLLESADIILNVVNIGDMLNDLKQGDYDFEKMTHRAKLLNDAISSQFALVGLLDTVTQAEKEKLPPELKRLKDLEDTLKGTAQDLASTILQGELTRSNLAVLVADVAKIYAHKSRMETAQRLAEDQRERLMAGGRWQLAYSSLYEAQRRKEKVKEVYQKVGEAIKVLDSSCLSAYCRGVAPSMLSVKNPKIGIPEPAPSAKPVAKVPYYGELVVHYNNELSSSLSSFTTAVSSLTVTRPCFGDTRCDVFPLYEKRRELAYESTGIGKWSAAAQLKALNEKLSSFDAAEGIILAPKKENLHKYIDAKGAYIPGCPYLSIALTVREGSLKRLLRQIDERRAQHPLYPIRDQVRKDNDLMTQTYEWLESIRKTANEQPSYDENQYYDVLRQTVTSLGNEKNKWQQELAFLERNLPEQDVYLGTYRKTIGGIQSELSQRIDQLKGTLVWHNIETNPALQSFVDKGIKLREEIRGFEKDIKEGLAKKYGLTKGYEIKQKREELLARIDSLTKEFDTLKEDAGKFAAQLVVNSFPDKSYEDLRKSYEGRQIATHGIGYITVTFPETAVVPEPPLVEKIPVCEDKDSGRAFEGKDIEVKSNVIINGKIVYTDSCAGTAVKEGSCTDAGTLAVMLRDCVIGMTCEQGACITTPSSPEEQPPVTPPTGGDSKLLIELPPRFQNLFEFPSEYGIRAINPVTGKVYEYNPEQLAHLPLISGNVYLGKKKNPKPNTKGIDYEPKPESFLKDKDRNGLQGNTKATPNAENEWTIAVTSEAAGDVYINLLADVDQSGDYGGNDWVVQNQKVIFSKKGTQFINLTFTLPQIPDSDKGLMIRIIATLEPAEALAYFHGNAKAFHSNNMFAPLYVVKGGESETYLIKIKGASVPQTFDEIIKDIRIYGPSSKVNDFIPDFAKKILGTNHINLYIKDNGKAENYRITTIDGKLEMVSRGRMLYPKPTMKIEISRNLLNTLFQSPDPLPGLKNAIDTNQIKIEKTGLVGTFVSRAALAALKFFSILPGGTTTIRSTGLRTSKDWGYCPGDCHVLFYWGSSQVLSYHFGIDPAKATGVTFRMYAALDDTYSLKMPYTLDVSFNGQSLGDDVILTGLEKGRPFGGEFKNFAVWEFRIPVQHFKMGENIITLSDLKSGGGTVKSGWIVLEWSELEVYFK